MWNQLNGIQVLLVEDEPDIAELLVFLLNDAGATVIHAASGFEALQKLDQGLPHVIVCNLRLPNMTGAELLQCIRAYRPESGKSIPVIAVTSYTREFALPDITKAGFDRFLPKPLEPGQLIAEILELVDA